MRDRHDAYNVVVPATMSMKLRWIFCRNEEYDLRYQPKGDCRYDQGLNGDFRRNEMLIGAFVSWWVTRLGGGMSLKRFLGLNFDFFGELSNCLF